jgi:anthranilate phosphoribosyltransferase
MKYAIGPRKEIGIRTIFNVLGPLTNPARASSQLMGVFSPNLTETMATVLNNMGTLRAYVVHGMDPLDEISISSPTKISEINNGTVTTYTVQPEDFGISRSPIAAIRGDNPIVNAQIIRDVLKGNRGPCRDVVIINSAFALAASGVAATPHEGMKIAAESIDSGAAVKKLEELALTTKNM